MARTKDQRRTYHLDGGMFHLPTGKEAEPPLPVGDVAACRISPGPDAEPVEFTDAHVLRTVILDHFTTFFRVPDPEGETERLFRYTMCRDEEPESEAEPRPTPRERGTYLTIAEAAMIPDARTDPKALKRARDYQFRAAIAKRTREETFTAAELAAQERALASEIARRIAGGEVQRA